MASIHFRISSNLRLSILLTAITVLSGSAVGQSHREAIQRFLAEEHLQGASIGFCAVDLKSGEEHLALNADLSLVPASAVKTVVTHAALDAFGPDHRFKTELFYSGELTAQGVLHGDLIIKGHGDPTLGSSYFNDQDFLNAWIMAIRNAGIDQVQGNIIVDDSYFEGPPLHGSTPIEDAGNYYAAGSYGINVFDNSYDLSLQTHFPERGMVSVMDTEPELGLIFDCRVTTAPDQRDNAYIYGIPGTNERVIYGTIPESSERFTIKGAVSNPAFLLGQLLKAKLEQKGMVVSGQPVVSRKAVVRGDEKPIFSKLSPPLSEIVRLTNLKSVNLYATCLLKHLGMKESGEGSFDAGKRALRSMLELHTPDLTGLNVLDGSGLSRANTITARQLANACRYWTSATEEAFVAGLKPHHSIPNLRMKSGYISGVRAYAGRMTLSDGKEVAFAVMVNNYSCSPAQARQAIERLLESLMV